MPCQPGHLSPAENFERLDGSMQVTMIVLKNKCKLCDYDCGDPSTVWIHLKTHTGEKIKNISKENFERLDRSMQVIL